MLTIVITGSREWDDPEAVARLLRGADALVVGCCPTGADKHALDAALESDVMPFILAAGKSRAAELRADLKARGAVATVIQATEQTIRERRASGPERNQAIANLAADFRDNLGADVRAYALPLPGSIGTHDCRRWLEKARFDVAVIEPVLW